MSFFTAGDFSDPIEPAPGMRLRVLTRGTLMFSLVELEEGAESPVHSHEEEQMGIILGGRFERFQGGETGILEEGDGFYVPPNVEHGGRAVGGPCTILDVFTPPRATYVTPQG
jgi:quercetin dioxygenase-like cupin family protein